MFPFISDAIAQDGSSASQSPFFSMIPFILIFVVFYFLLIRPQQKKQKVLQAKIKEMKKGDYVITNGGIHGMVYKLGDDIITLEIADKIRIQVDRHQIGKFLDKRDKKENSAKDNKE